MSNKQSRRAAFYAKQRKSRQINRVIRDNRKTPGFIGVVTSFQLSLSTFGENLAELRKAFEGFGAAVVRTKR